MSTCKRGHVDPERDARGRCKECEREQARKRYAANLERKREQACKRYEANLERRREQARKRYAANLERKREQRRKWRAANLERAREQARKRRAANLERTREQARKWRAANPALDLWRGARRRAKQRGTPFTITATDVARLVADTPVCPVFGTPFVHGVGKLHSHSRTLDALVPELGYTPENVRLISHRANMIKSNATPDELHLVAAWVYREQPEHMRWTNVHALPAEVAA